MKNKGFTLIELLGVVVILSLLIILVFPNIIGSVKKSSEKTDELTYQVIYNATDLYISKYPSMFPKIDGNKFSLTLSELVSEDLLASPIKLADGVDLTDIKSVQITYTDINGFTYELKDNNESIIQYKKEASGEIFNTYE